MLPLPCHYNAPCEAKQGHLSEEFSPTFSDLIMPFSQEFVSTDFWFIKT